MGGSSGQVTGYRYYANFLLFIGNPIEKLLSINFDKRGWVPYNQFSTESMLNIDEAYMYGENEGGVFGDIDIYTGTSTQEVNTTYKNYMESIGLQASAYPYQSYLVFRGGPAAEWSPAYGQPFYLGNSGYMKEMLLWPKRIHVRNDGRGQWYDLKSEIGLQWFEDKTIELKQHYLDTAGDFFTKYETNRRFSSSGGVFTNSNPPSRVLGGSFGYQGSETYGLSSDVGWPIKSDGETIATYSPNYSGGFSFKVEILSVGRTTIKNISAGDSYFVILDAWDIDTSGYGYHTNGYLIECFVYPGESISLKLNTEFLDEVTTTHHAIQIIPREPRLGIIHKGSASGTDINPIHKIREILTDDTAMNKPESSVNNENFMRAADRIWDEGLGISWSITEKACIDAINELCYHIEAGIRVNRQTGLYEMVLFRDDWFEEDEIHTIAENKIKKGSMQYEITNADEVVNQVNVNYYDRANIKNSSFSISESGLIQTLGQVNAETVDFPYFMNMRNAEIVANWKLKILSTGVLKGAFTTGWREARKWNRYDLIRLPWSRRWVEPILVRIMNIKLGSPTSNEVSIEWIEVVPATGIMNTTIVADEPIDKPLPPQACQYESFEMPYYLAVMALGQRKADEELAYESNFGLVGVVAEKPQENSLYAVMMTNNYDEWVRAGSIQYSQTADSDQVISRTATSFTVKNWKKIANVPAGRLIQCGKEWLTGFSEWMVFQGVDPDTGVVSVKRGALDTQPQQWDLGLKLYFCGTDVAYDATEYVAGEKVLVSALTTTPSGVLEQKGSNLVEMKARAIRPYPPANVKINGEYWPDEIETDLILTWVNRNRLQQTGGEILGWFDVGVAIEPNTQTHLILSQLNENNTELATTNENVTGSTSYTMPISNMHADARTVEIVLKTVRDGYECLNPFVHKVDLSQFFSAPYDLTVEFKND